MVKTIGNLDTGVGNSSRARNCRFCGAILQHTFVDLGMSPLCESILSADRLNQMEPFYPLHTYVCEQCFLVQLEEFVSPEEIFTEYDYFSSYATSWLQHAKNYTELMVNRFGLNQRSNVVEVASNDGYLLQYFVEKGIPVLGIEPAVNVAKVAVEKGIPTLTEFFGSECAHRLLQAGRSADLIVGNNVLAQVPALNDFVEGLRILLEPSGVVTIEFPHLSRLIEENQFDTIYHEHFSYFSFYSAEKIFAAHGLRLFDVDELPTHGGSLRIYACHDSDDTKPTGEKVKELREREVRDGIAKLKYYESFGQQVKETKYKLLSSLIEIKGEGKTIAGYGAPGKGNTLLNYCGIRTDFIDYLVDRNPYKHGMYTPGTHIPIFPPEKIRDTKPDYVMILPWNLKNEIVEQLSYIREWGGQFIVPIPEVSVFS